VDSSIVGAVNSIGRYFVVVSLLPASVFVLYVYLLVRSGVWSGRADLVAAIDLQVRDIVPVALAALLLALTMNPLQLGVIQLFEGYWGPGRLAVRLAQVRVLHHRRRKDELSMAEEPAANPADEVRQAVRSAERRRMLGSYPEEHKHVLPTRLGNVLRRYESMIGKPYGLDALSVVPRLGMVADERQVAYVENQRVQLELATRTSFLAMAAVPVTIGLTWRAGLWMLLALLPYAVAFFAYRGAVGVAHEYGTSIAVMVDLSRFSLYERLRLKLPADTDAERETNRRVREFFELRAGFTLDYDQPSPPGDGAA
jgi:hypothetical protein